MKPSSAALALLAAALACGDPTGPANGFRTRWYLRGNYQAFARPLIIDSIIVAGDGAGVVSARMLRDARVVWSNRVFLDAVDGNAILRRDSVLVVASNFETAGLDARTGRVLWRYRAPLDTVDAGPNPGPGFVGGVPMAVDSELVIVPAWGISVSALELHRGAFRWVWTLGRLPSDTAASGVFRSIADGATIAGDTVYVDGYHATDSRLGGGEAFLVALDRRTGRELWRFITRYPNSASPVRAPIVIDRLAIVTLHDGRLLALRRDGTGIEWEFAAPDRPYTIFESPAFADGVLYHEGGDLALWAIDAATGVPRWRSPVEGGVSRQITVDGNTIYFPSPGQIFAYDRATGRPLGHTKVAGGGDTAVESAPAFGPMGGVMNTSRGLWAFTGPRP